MKFLRLDDAREIIPIGCRLLRLFGLGNNERFKLVYWIQIAIYLVFSLIPRFLLQLDDTVMVLRFSSEIMFISYLCFQMVALYFRRAHLYQLVDMLKQCAGQPCSEDIQAFFIRSNVKINKSSVSYVRFFLILYILYCTMAPIASIGVYMRNARNETSEKEEFIISSEMKFVLRNDIRVASNWLTILLLVTACTIWTFVTIHCTTRSMRQAYSYYPEYLRSPCAPRM
ncbi:uncharacterized protein LOC118510805 [Anopheles stephensi]|uniref:uncharacterized protein LOC118510805 n=1 Tax=Anopheles stephensi TaxID=30069 RepID=UPI001658769A|nr:uncharacterized protein LOC118510805 [Anopheles stephensi]